jgi:hypothetical protein
MGPTHRIWGAHQGVALGAAVGSLWGPYVAISNAVLWSGLGYAFASVPDAIEGPLGLKHRGLSHWPEPPFLLALLALAVAASLDYLAMMIGLSIAGICNSLLSHWTGDLMFGKAHMYHGHMVRPRGVPYLFGTKHFGFGGKVDSPLEKRFRKFLHVTLPVSFVIVFYVAMRS